MIQRLGFTSLDDLTVVDEGMVACLDLKPIQQGWLLRFIKDQASHTHETPDTQDVHPLSRTTKDVDMDPDQMSRQKPVPKHVRELCVEEELLNLVPRTQSAQEVPKQLTPPDSVGPCRLERGHASYITRAKAPFRRYTVDAEYWKSVRAGSSTQAGGPLQAPKLQEGELCGNFGAVCALALSPTDSNCLVSAGWDHALYLHDLEAGTCRPTLSAHTGFVYSLDMLSDGRRALSGGEDRSVCLWDLQRGAPLAMMTGHKAPLCAVAASPDGRCALSGSKDSTVRIWDLSSGACRMVLKGHTGAVKDVEVMADGYRAVSCGADKTLRVWDLRSSCSVSTLVGHSESVHGLALTPDGRHAVSASLDHSLRVWDLLMGRCTAVLRGHSDWVVDVAVTADGSCALSASHDKTIRVWDLGSCTRGDGPVCRAVLQGHALSVTSVLADPTGQFAFSGSSDRSLRVWELESWVD